MTRQDQNVSEGGTAYQAGGTIEVHHHHGVTPQQMVEIIDAVTGHVMSLQDDAFKEIDSRLNEFRKNVIEAFSKPSSGANLDAFREPDYQFALKDAQEGFARSGDASLRDDLISLLIERSKHPTSSRRAMVLNEAIRIASKLTSQECAALVVNFAFTRVRFFGPSAYSILGYMSETLNVFIKDLDQVDDSLAYLEGMGCVSVSSVGNIDIWKHFCDTYRESFSRGFSDTEIMSIFPDQMIPSILTSILSRPPELCGKLQFSVQTKQELVGKLNQLSIEPRCIDSLLKLFDDTSLPDMEIRAVLQKFFPSFFNVLEIWTATSLQRTTLTAVGKAISYSCLVARSVFEAPIEIWVN